MDPTHKKDPKVVAIIPARYHSNRFEGKPLAMIMDKPMIQHVYERAQAVDLLSEVAVATVVMAEVVVPEAKVEMAAAVVTVTVMVREVAALEPAVMAEPEQVVLVVAPEAGTSPVPVQPVATYWVVPLATGEPATSALVRVP